MGIANQKGIHDTKNGDRALCNSLSEDISNGKIVGFPSLLELFFGDLLGLCL